MMQLITAIIMFLITAVTLTIIDVPKRSAFVVVASQLLSYILGIVVGLVIASKNQF